MINTRSTEGYGEDTSLEHYSVESDELSRLLADGVRESGVEAEASEEAEEFRRSRGWNTR